MIDPSISTRIGAEYNLSFRELAGPKYLSTMDIVYTAFGLPGLVVWFGLHAGILITLIWMRIHVYRTEKKGTD